MGNIYATICSRKIVSWLSFLGLLLILSLWSQMLCAQNLRGPRFIGCVIDARSHEALSGALIQTIRVENNGDSVVMRQNLTDSLGRFSVRGFSCGGKERYFLQAAYLGYYPGRVLININTMSDTVSLDTIRLRPSDLMLESAFVKGHRGKFSIVGDTVVFHPEAYHLDKGARMDELFDQLPGVQLRDGKYYWLGKPMEVIFNGEKLFTKAEDVLNSLPAEAIDHIAAYEKGKEGGDPNLRGNMMLDIKVKKKWMEAWYGNVRAGGGDHKKYVLSTEATHLSNTVPTYLKANINNIGEQNTYHGDYVSVNAADPATQQSVQGQFSYLKHHQKTKTSWNFRSSVDYSHTRQDLGNGSSTENFLTDSTSQYTYAKGRNLSKRQNMGWSFESPIIGEHYSISIYGNFKHSESTVRGNSSRATYDADPYAFLAEPAELWQLTALSDSVRRMAVNSQRNQNYSTYMSNNVSFNVSYQQEIGRKRTPLVSSFSADIEDSRGRDFDRYDISYYHDAHHSTERSNRYNKHPDKRTALDFGEGWVQPLGKIYSATVSYHLHYEYGRSESSFYRLDRLVDGNQLDLGLLPQTDSLDHAYDASNSSLSVSKNLSHVFSLGLQGNWKRLTLTGRLRFIPQHEHLDYRRGVIDTTTVRNTSPLEPSLSAAIKLSLASQFSASYSYSTNYPWLEQMIPYTDSSQPLLIVKGNPDLKKGHSHNVYLRFSGNYPKHEQTVETSLYYTYTTRTTGLVSRYYSATGAVVNQPENVRGGFNLVQEFQYQRSFGERFSASYNETTRYEVNYAWVSVGKDPEIHENSMRNLRMENKLALNYSYEKLCSSLKVLYRYEHLKNILQPTSCQERSSLGFGLEGQWRSPWGDVKTDFTLITGHGYFDPTMNKLRKLWNVSFERKVLKNNGTLTLAFTDIFRNLTNYQHSVYSNSHTESWSDMAVNYVLFTFRYNLEKRGE